MISEKKLTILDALRRRKMREEIDGPLSGPEIGETIFRHQRVKHGVREWAGAALRDMAKEGLVEALGTSQSNARCYTITTAGLKVLSDAEATP